MWLKLGNLDFQCFTLKEQDKFWRTEVLGSLQEMRVMIKEMAVLMSKIALKKIGAAGAEIWANTVYSWPPIVLPRDAQSNYPNFVQVFAYGALSI